MIRLLLVQNVRGGRPGHGGHPRDIIQMLSGLYGFIPALLFAVFVLQTPGVSDTSLTLSERY